MTRRYFKFLSSFLFATLTLTGVASAQRPRHADTWVFGTRCRLGWNAAGTAATSTLDPVLSTAEGSATFSDPDTGVPLIVTDGNTVWNGVGGMLATGLMGDASSMHAGIIVPVPGTPGQVYVFGHPSTVSSQISYRAFDTTGLGTALGTGASAIALPASQGREGMIAIPHTNGRDFWIVISGATQIFVVPVTPTGVGAAVAYPTQVNVWTNGWHMFAASPDGRRLAISGNSISARAAFESLPFDPTTGVVSAGTLFTASSDYRQAYGGAFSPDGTKLYFATLDEVQSGGTGPILSRAVQYDFTTSTFTNLHNSTTRYSHGDVRRGPDGRMYMAGNSIGANLSVIATPNAAGAAAGYSNASYALIGTCTTQLGIGQAIDNLYSLRFRCGDGVVSGSEACDDGNTADGDGCSAACTVETNSSCAPLLINGGFEAGALGNDLTGAALTGWTISAGTIDHSTSYPHTEGNAAIDLTGCAAGTITQTVPTVPGTTYRLLFDYGANSFDNLRFAAEALDSAGATLRSTEFRADASALSAGTRLVSGEISFTATTATTTIRFRTTLNNACGGNWLDNVRLGPSTCDTICGNGRIDTGETCDDANTTAGDGCSATCTVESGFACANPDILLVNYNGSIGTNQRTFLDTRGTVTVDGGATITSAFLSRFDVVIFNGIRTFTAAEATALSTWVSAGGGLFLFTGHSNDASIATAATTMLTGVGIQVVAPNFSSAATMQRHPVSTGVSPAIPFNGGFAVRTVVGGPLVGGTTFAVGGTTSLGVAGSLGAGRAVVYGDEWIYFDSEWTGNAGVRRFWPNVMDWITGASACDRLCGNGVVNTGEACDDGNLTSSDGCSNACAVEPGYTCTGMPSVCSICVDSGEGIDTGCTAAAPVCVGTGGSATCVACIDNGAGTVVDSGCTMGAPLCLGTGATASCQPCQDTTSGGTDLGCMMGAPACASSGGANICLACEDSAPGTMIDNGCVMDTPLCAMTSGGGVQCVQCVLDSQCTTGTVCSPTTNTCVPGCDMNDDCAATAATPVCDVMARVCVPCLTTADCHGTETCTAMHECVQPDSDNDGVADNLDLDDDNDGIPDSSELPAGLSTDSDMDGIIDFQDPDFVTCTAGTNGACTELPANVDFDRDGIPNQLDLDADGDGIIDVTEGGGMAAPDGTIAGFADLNMNGLADAVEATPLPLPNSDGSDLDLADFLDVDSDNDSLNDAVEGFDADHDGTADTDAAGIDTDQDGIDDAFDLDCAAATDCGGVIGVVAPLPDTDTDTRPDYRDVDDDGDGMNTSVEVQDAMDYTGTSTTPEDIDGDGQPNWLDTDSDGDTATDRTESGGDRDNDDNGILDYLDPNYAPTDTDGDGVIDTVECPAPATVAMGNCPDSDMDGSPDYDDVDDDNDGIPTSIEEMAGPNSDGDGRPNRIDLDSDDDGITDLREQNGGDVDGNNDGAIDSARDADMDGIDAAFDGNDMDAMIGFRAMTTGLDTDRDGQIDAVDLDADGDGITDIIEGGGRDTDRDGKVDGATDANNNGIRDAAEGTGRLAVPDTDMDGDADFQDIDADGDGKNDAIEGHDVNHDGVADVRPRGTDANNNGLDDAYEAMGGTPAPLPDTDGDMTPDYRDTDDDGDGVLSRYESPGTLDTDMDGTPNYLDRDDDGDGINTVDEAPDANRDGNPMDARDTDGDGIPDYLDPTGTLPTTGGLAGGACGCAVNTTRSTSGLFAMLGMLALVAVRRRRKH